MKATLSATLVLATVLASAAQAQQPYAPDSFTKYRIFLTNGNAVEGTLRFEGANAVIMMSIGKMVVPKERISGFVDPRTGATFDWKEFVKETPKPADGTSTGTGTPGGPENPSNPSKPPTPRNPDESGPKEPLQAKVETALTDWAAGNYEEPARMQENLKALIDPPAPYIAEHMAKMAPKAWEPAARALIALEDHSVLVALRDVLAAGNSDLRLAALKAMIRLGSPPEDYLAKLTDSDERLRLAALEGVAGLSDARYLQFIPDLLLDDSKNVRTAAADTLFRKANEWGMLEEAASFVGDRFDRATAGQKEVLIDVLGRLGTDAAVMPLAPLLTSDDPIEAKASAVALSKIDLPSAREALRDALAGAVSDERIGYVIQLMESCERQKDVRAVPALSEYLAHDNRTIAQRAARALEAVSNQKGRPANAEDWMKWYTENEKSFPPDNGPRARKTEKETTP